MSKPWTCPYCKRMMDEKLEPDHEPACKTAAQLVALFKLLHEALKPQTELKPEGEVAEHKCPQCYIFMPDEQIFGVHVPLCKLVNEARLIYNALKRKQNGIEEQLARLEQPLNRIADALWEANADRAAEHDGAEVKAAHERYSGEGAQPPK